MPNMVVDQPNPALAGGKKNKSLKRKKSQDPSRPLVIPKDSIQDTKIKADYDPKDDEELELEGLVFGADHSETLQSVLDRSLHADLDRELGRHRSDDLDRDDEDEDDDAEDGDQDGQPDDASAFFIDTRGNADNSMRLEQESEAQDSDLESNDQDEEMDDEDEAEVEDDAYERKPAWEDDDDITINIADVKRLRKLRNSESETVLSGAEYEARLRTQFERIYPPPKWSTLPEKKEQPSKIDLLKFLRSTRSIVARSKHAMLPSDQIDVTRMKDANQTAYSQAVIQTAVFHPKAPVLMTAGFDRTVRLFQVDGKINPKIQSIFFKDMPIHCASFTADGKQIILSGRRKFFYVYDIEKGSVEKVHSIYGREEKSLEKHYVSPCNRYLAFLGRDGYIVLVSNKSKQWIGNLKMNGTVKDLDFSSDGQYIFSIGGDGEVYQWELSSLSCIHRFVDDGAIRPSCISVSKDGSYMATGSGAGVVNVYSTASCLSSPTPKPLKTIMNLVTTIHSVRFHPSSQLLAISSRKKKDALKLVHLPSLNVFPNWPTSATPLSYVNAVSFSPGGGYIVMGNDKGKVLLYRLGAYDGY